MSRTPRLREHKYLTGAQSSGQLWAPLTLSSPSTLRAIGCIEAPSCLEELPGLAPLGGCEDIRAHSIPSSILSLLDLDITRLLKRLVGLWHPIERDTTGSGNLARGKQPCMMVMAALGPTSSAPKHPDQECTISEACSLSEILD